jgi:hypothetical protein
MSRSTVSRELMKLMFPLMLGLRPCRPPRPSCTTTATRG